MQQNRIVILKDDSITVIKKTDGPIELYEYPVDNIDNLERGYILILPDRFINLIYTDLTPVKTKKLNELVRVYLKSLYPEEVLGDADFGFVNTSPVTAYLLTEEIKSIINTKTALIEKADLTTTPSLIALQVLRNRFLLTTKDTMLIKNNEEFIHIIGKLEGIDTSGTEQQIEIKEDDHEILTELIARIPDRDTLRSIDLNLLKTKKPLLTTLKVELILLSILYCIFIVSLILNLLPLKKERDVYNEKIKEIYKQLKIQDTSDPYGMLIFKLDKLKKEYLQFPDPLKILSATSLAFDQDSDIENITANKELVRVKGRARTLETLEKSLKSLEEELGINFNTESAKVKDNFVNFVIVGRSKK